MRLSFLLILFVGFVNSLSAQIPAKDSRDAKEREVVNEFWNSLGETFKDPKSAEKRVPDAQPKVPKSTETTTVQQQSQVPAPAKPADIICTTVGLRKELDSTTWYLRSEDRKGWIKLGVDANAVLTGSFAYGPLAGDKDIVTGTLSGTGEVVRDAEGCDYVLRCVWKADNGTEEVNDLHIKPGSGIIGTTDGSKKPWGGIRL
jgi:hypothetical protein